MGLFCEMYREDEWSHAADHDRPVLLGPVLAQIRVERVFLKAPRREV